MRDRSSSRPVSSSPSPEPMSPPATSSTRAPHPSFSSLAEEEEFLGPLETPPPLESAGPVFVAGSDVDPLDPSSDRTSSPGDGAGKPLGKGALRGAIRQALRTGTGAANRLLSRNQIEQDNGLWLADDEDLDGISAPLANIAHRRGGVAGMATANPDVADAIATLIAVAGYVSKQFALRLQLRAYAAAARAAQQPAEDADQQAAA